MIIWRMRWPDCIPKTYRIVWLFIVYFTIVPREKRRCERGREWEKGGGMCMMKYARRGTVRVTTFMIRPHLTFPPGTSTIGTHRGKSVRFSPDAGSRPTRRKVSAFIDPATRMLPDFVIPPEDEDVDDADLGGRGGADADEDASAAWDANEHARSSRSTTT
jgi:hypothetical protein